MNSIWIKWSVAVVTAVMWMGCASSGSYKMYAGPERPAEKTAVMSLPYVLEVMALDGGKAEIPPAVMRSNAEYELAILPGHHELAVRYSDPFVNYEETDNSDRGYRIDKTAPFFLTVEAVAGHHYRIEYKTKKQDPSLKRNEVKVWVVDQGTVSGEVKGARMESPETESAQVMVVDTRGDKMVNPSGEKGSERKPLPSINAADQLKFWWYRANADERQDFLYWMREGK